MKLQPSGKRALRREKRQKKLAEQGEDRLASIKALNGGIAPPDEVLGGPGAQQPQAASVANDPEEVDISQNQSGFGTPSNQNIDAQQNPLAAAMLQMQQQEVRKQQQNGADGNSADDPMVKMMQQMVGLMGGDPNDPNAKPPEIPPMMKAMLGGGQTNKEEAPPATGSAYLWRIVHAIFAFILATYIALTSTFNGTKLGRSGKRLHARSGLRTWTSDLPHLLYVGAGSAELKIFRGRRDSCRVTDYWRQLQTVVSYQSRGQDT